MNAREAARRTQCKNNLRQLGVALQNYATTYKVFPPSLCIGPGDFGKWSMQARLLSFLEQGTVEQQIDYALPYDAQPAVIQLRIPTLLCPSETQDRPSTSDGLAQYPINYGANQGTWLVYQPSNALTGQGGDGAFLPNMGLSPASFLDGLTNTLAMSEVKTFQPVVKESPVPSLMAPSLPAAISALGGSGNFDAADGHTEWVEGRVHQTGFTTTFPPNTKVSYQMGGVTYDIDYTSAEEGDGLTATYAAVTARSWHAGIVHVLLADGSSRGVADSVTLDTWRSLGSRNDGNSVGRY